MASSNQKQSRRDQILQALAHMLETSPGQRITTARLAAEVGVSEAALYRHFPSKARMFEGLIDFIEDSLLSRVNLIMAEEKDTMARCHHIQLKQALREKRLREGQGFQLDETMLANLLLAYAEGRISQFVRSEFKLKPTAGFEDQWQFMRSQLLQS